MTKYALSGYCVGWIFMIIALATSISIEGMPLVLHAILCGMFFFAGWMTVCIIAYKLRELDNPPAV